MLASIIVIDYKNGVQPIDVADLDLAFPAQVKHLMPPYEEIPEQFRGGQSPWTRVVQTWFYKGLSAAKLHTKPGVDGAKALRHLSCIINSFEPKHEHKMAAVAFLMSQWFEEDSL